VRIILGQQRLQVSKRPKSRVEVGRNGNNGNRGTEKKRIINNNNKVPGGESM
jgi:hypothetical protein